MFCPWYSYPTSVGMHHCFFFLSDETVKLHQYFRDYITVQQSLICFERYRPKSSYIAQFLEGIFLYFFSPSNFFATCSTFLGEQLKVFAISNLTSLLPNLQMLMERNSNQHFHSYAINEQRLCLMAQTFLVFIW